MNIKTIDIVIPIYNDNPHLLATLSSIFVQTLPLGWALHVYVVDDGSESPISIDDYDVDERCITLVRLENNKGVSIARNKGASVGVGEAILFLDADCSMVHDNVIAVLLGQYIAGVDLCFGQIHAGGDFFWARYQNEVALRRAESFNEGAAASMTSQIFLVNRVNFHEVRGFDEKYHFGFEDRDLFITLIENGASVALEEQALVNHNDELSLMSVTKKIFKSGKESSALFIQKHPEYYNNMSYVSADVRFSRGLLVLLVIFTRPILWPLVKVIDVAINGRLLPFYILKSLVKYTSGLAYLHGTYDA